MISRSHGNLFSLTCFLLDVELVEIGVVKHKYLDDFVRDNKGKFGGVVEIFEKFSEGLSGLEKYRNMFLITIMHKKLKEVQPLKIKTKAPPEKGAYA